MLEHFCNGDEKLEIAMYSIISELYDAKEYGSIVIITPQDCTVLYCIVDLQKSRMIYICIMKKHGINCYCWCRWRRRWRRSMM